MQRIKRNFEKLAKFKKSCKFYLFIFGVKKMNTFHLNRSDAVNLFGDNFACEIASEVESFKGSYVAVRAEFLNGDEESPLFCGVLEAPENFLINLYPETLSAFELT